MLAYFLFCLLIFQLYYYIITRHIRDWKSLNIIPSSTNSFNSSITILIPARNEGENIVNCIESVLRNTYPKDKYQVLIINDHSDDNTLEICEEYASEFPNVQILSLPENQIGKKAALIFGMENATNEIICTLDADSTISTTHLQTISTYFDDSEKMIFTGPVRFSYDSSFTKMMAMELAGLMVITGAGYLSKWHHLANGTNMGFRKDPFDVLDGYRGSEKYASGDDMFLMNKYKIRYPKTTGFLKSKGAIVKTKAPQNFSDFYQQRIRWSTKNKSFPDRGMKAVLIIMFLTSLLIPLSIFLAVWGGFTFLIIAIIGLMIKSVADYQLIKTGAKYFDISGWRKIFIPSELFQITYVLIIGIASLFRSKFTWKGRSVQ